VRSRLNFNIDFGRRRGNSHRVKESSKRQEEKSRPDFRTFRRAAIRARSAARAFCGAGVPPAQCGRDGRTTMRSGCADSRGWTLPPHAARFRTRLLAACGRRDAPWPASGRWSTTTHPTVSTVGHESLPRVGSRELPPSTLLARESSPALSVMEPTMLKMARSAARGPTHPEHSGVSDRRGCGWEIRIPNSSFRIHPVYHWAAPYGSNDGDV
jgi:hypothetical protein